MMRLLLAAAAAGIAMMAWGTLYWAGLSGPGAQIKALPEEAAWLEQMGTTLNSGSYAFPFQPTGVEANPEAQQNFNQRHLKGPLGMLQIRREGQQAMGLGMMLWGFVHYFISALIAATILRWVQPALPKFAARVTFVTLLGLFAAVAVRLGDPIWWGLPWAHNIHGAVMVLLNWIIAGFVLATIIKPVTGFTHETDPNRPLWKRAMDVD